MANFGKWAPVVLRTFLDYIDEHKGVIGFLSTNLKEAIDNVTEILNTQYSPPGETIYTANQVYGKISGIVEKYAAEDRFRTNPALYQFGTDILDLALLPVGTYTEEEIAASHEIDTSSFELVTRPAYNQTFTPEMHRVLIDVLEENKGIDGLFMANRLEACKLALAELEKRVPPERLIVVSVEQIDRKIGHLVDKSIGLRKDGRWAKKQQLFIGGLDVLDLRAFESGVFTQDEIDAWARARKQQSTTSPSRKRRRVAGSEVPDSDDDSSIHANDPTTMTAFNGVLTFGNGTPIITRSSESSLDTTKIASNMSNIFQSITDAVRMRLKAAGLDPIQPCIISLEQTSGDMSELLEGLLARDRSELADGVQAFDNMRASRHLPIEVFIQAFVGMALTTWVLRRRPQGEKDVNVFAKEILREVYRQFPSEASTVRKNALTAFLDKHIEPRIKQRASDCADRLNSMLLRYMTPPASDRSAHLDNGFEVGQKLPADWSESPYFPTQESSRAQQPETETNPKLPISKDRRALRSGNEHETGYSDFVADWKKALAAIFYKAFQLRIDMEKQGGDYDFTFPTPGLRYVASDEEGNPKGHPQDVLKKQKKVMLGLLPAISVRMKDSRGRLGESMLCAPFKVYSYND